MAGMRRNPLTARRTGRPQNASVSGGASFSDFSELFGMGAPVASGQVVTPESAMRFSAVFACVRLLGGAVASAPVTVYLREGSEERQLAHGHPLADVLRLRPNRFMTSTTFWKTFVAHKVLQGNGYAHIIRARSGEPVGLYPLNPRNVVVYWAWELGLDQRLGVERNWSVGTASGACPPFRRRGRGSASGWRRKSPAPVFSATGCCRKSPWPIRASSIPK